MSTWQDVPLYKRSEGKSTLLYLDDKEQRLNNRYKELDETGKKIHGLLKENGEMLRVENYDTDAWRNYVDYVDQMVLEGFRKIIHCNLVFFLRETDPTQNPDPLFESQLQLQVKLFFKFPKNSVNFFRHQICYLIHRWMKMIKIHFPN
jgi:dynein heavy chain